MLYLHKVCQHGHIMKLTNVVAQGDLQCHFDLRELTLRLANARYDPRSFSAVIWQHRRIGGNCLIFANGKINCNGKSVSLRAGVIRLRRYARILQKMGYLVNLTNVRLVTASAVHHFNVKVNPERLPDYHYEPELFPSVMFRKYGIHFSLTLNGTLIITGIRGESDLTSVYAVMLELELFL